MHFNVALSFKQDFFIINIQIQFKMCVIHSSLQETNIDVYTPIETI